MTLYQLAIACTIISIAAMFYMSYIAVFSTKASRYLNDTLEQLEDHDEALSELITLSEFNSLVHADIPFADNTREMAISASRAFGLVIIFNGMFMLLSYFNTTMEFGNLLAAAVINAAVIAVVIMVRQRASELEAVCYHYDSVLTSIEFEKEMKSDPKSDVE